MLQFLRLAAGVLSLVVAAVAIAVAAGSPKVPVVQGAEQQGPASTDQKQETGTKRHAASGQSQGQPHRIRPLDLINVRVTGTLRDQPIDGKHFVEPDGQVALGPAYGRTHVTGLTTEQAEARIKGNLMEVLRRPEVRVAAAGKVTRWRGAVLPKSPYKIGPGDGLLICATDVLPKMPLHEVFVVQPSGTVLLGSKYGEVQVRGLTLEGAEKAVRQRLKQLAPSADVSITVAVCTAEWTQNLPKSPFRVAPGDLLDIRVANTLPDWPIDGLHVVEPDGQVALGPAYGRTNLKGLTLQEAEANVDKHLREVLRRPEVSITPWGWKGDDEPIRQCPRPAAASASSPSAILPRPPPMCCIPMSCLAPLPPRGVAITPLPAASWPPCDLDALTGTDLDGLRKYWGGDVTLRAGAGPTTAPLPGFRWPPCDLDGRVPLWGGAANCPLGLHWRLPADARSGQR